MGVEYLTKFSTIFDVVLKAGNMVSEAKNMLLGRADEAKKIVSDDMATDVDNEISHQHLTEIKKSAVHVMKDLKGVMNEIAEMLGFGDDDEETEETQETEVKKQMLDLAKSE